MTDEGPGGADEVGEGRILQSRADELLTGGVDVLAADLEEAVLIAQSLHALKLRHGVAGGHVGHAAEAQGVQFTEQLVEVAVLESLSALVTGDTVADIAEVGVSGEGAYLTGQSQNVRHRGALVGGGNVEAADELSLEQTQQIVDIVLTVHVTQVAFDLGAEL